MKILVLGSSGMAGHTISHYLLSKGHQVDGFDRNSLSKTTNMVGDIQKISLLQDVIEEGRYDSIINCIGVLNQFADKNKQMAVYLNSYLPHLLADLTKNLDTHVIQMSTDCVFSGQKGQYTESDFKDGESFYDRTKALGELDDDKNLTFRNSIVGPDMNKEGIGLLNWFMLQNDPIKGYTRVVWSGLTTLELAKAMEYAVKIKATGLYNMVYEEPISKYELLKLLNKHLRNNELLIEPFDDIVINKSLVRTRFDFDYIIPDYDQIVYELSEWIRNHHHFYKHLCTY